MGCKLRGTSHTNEIQRAVTLLWCWVLCCSKNWRMPSQPQAYLHVLCCLNFPLLKNNCKASPLLIFLSILPLFWLDLNATTLDSVNSIFREGNTFNNIYAIQSQRLSIVLWTPKNSHYLLQDWVFNWQVSWYKVCKVLLCYLWLSESKKVMYYGSDFSCYIMSSDWDATKTLKNWAAMIQIPT